MVLTIWRTIGHHKVCMVAIEVRDHSRRCLAAGDVPLCTAGSWVQQSLG